MCVGAVNLEIAHAPLLQQSSGPLLSLFEFHTVYAGACWHKIYGICASTLPEQMKSLIIFVLSYLFFAVKMLCLCLFYLFDRKRRPICYESIIQQTWQKSSNIVKLNVIMWLVFYNFVHLQINGKAKMKRGDPLQNSRNWLSFWPKLVRLGNR